MKIVVRYIGRSKANVSTFAVYADGLRVGFYKRTGEVVFPYRAVQWNHKLLGDFETDLEAATAVLEHYKHFRIEAKPKAIHGFKRHAARLMEGRDAVTVTHRVRAK